MITRNGKIARLPSALRETLNQRLHDGETGASLVAWLNALSEVQQILAEHFQARPITEQNLSEWKQGGFREWQDQEHAFRFLDRTDSTAAALDGRRPFASLLPEIAVTLWRATAAASEGALNDPGNQQALLRVTDRIIELRRAEQHDERLAFDRERLAFEKQCYEDGVLDCLPKTYTAAFKALKGCLKTTGHSEESADEAMGAMCRYFEQLRRVPNRVPAPPAVARQGQVQPNPAKSDRNDQAAAPVTAPQTPAAPAPGNPVTAKPTTIQNTRATQRPAAAEDRERQQQLEKMLNHTFSADEDGQASEPGRTVRNGARHAEVCAA